MVQYADVSQQTGQVVNPVAGPQGVHVEQAGDGLALHEDIGLVEVAVDRDRPTGVGGGHELLDPLGHGPGTGGVLRQDRGGGVRVVAGPLRPGGVRRQLHGACRQGIQQRDEAVEDAFAARDAHALGQQTGQGHSPTGGQQHEPVGVLPQNLGRGHA